LQGKNQCSEHSERATWRPGDDNNDTRRRACRLLAQRMRRKFARGVWSFKFISTLSYPQVPLRIESMQILLMA
jgi:hypothetical protein